MKLRKQVMALGLAGAVVAAAVGGIGLLATVRLGGALEASAQASQALQASQEADMMHDAIRGDGQMALFGLLRREPARIKDAGDGLQAHADTFNAALARLDALPLNEDSRTALASVKPLVASYIEAAQGLVVAAREGRTDADTAMATLQAAFSELEKQMAALSDAIERRGVRVNEDAATNVRRTRAVLAAALLLAFGALAAASWWLAGRMQADFDAIAGDLPRA